MIILPERFLRKMEEKPNEAILGITLLTQSKFNEVFSENNLYFFEEYTDHGFRHINSVLKACNELITEETFALLSGNDIALLILGIFLHDLGMHIQPLTFRNMISGQYDDVTESGFQDFKWSKLWKEYISEAKKFNDYQRYNLFGKLDVKIQEPNLEDIGSLTNNDRKLIGEFVRRYHPRIASEIVFKGVSTNSGKQLDFFTELDSDYRFLSGLLARSHGMSIRDTFKILRNQYNKIWSTPLNIQIVYLMSLLRLADYFQIDTSRVLKIPYQTKTFQSPVSFKEHQKHLQTKFVKPLDYNPEVLYVLAEPTNSIIFSALEDLFKDIQRELDSCWAILGEIYGTKHFSEQPKLTYRRIESNLDDKVSVNAKYPFVPERIKFTIDTEVSKLLIKPLYGHNPSFGVRELLQNSIDACYEREFLEQEKGNNSYKGNIKISIENSESEKFLFTIEDNGKGMSIDEIKNYFLKVGGSFRKSQKWQNDFTNIDGHAKIVKSGRFGVGVLAAYLLGNNIKVITKSMYENTGYCFQTTLNQEQIDVEKVKNLEIGTKIQMPISKTIFEMLDGAIKGNMNVLPFYKWFIGNTPAVQYIIDSGIKKNPYDDIILPDLYSNNDIHWNEIDHGEYNKVFWSYDFEKYNGFIICNNIVIPDNFTLGRYSVPAVIFFDLDAKLPLSLDRLKLNDHSFFHYDLMFEIANDIVASLLVFKCSNPYNQPVDSSMPTMFKHPSYQYIEHKNSCFHPLLILFDKKGFSLNHPTFLRFFIDLKKFTIVENIKKALGFLHFNAEEIDNLEMNFICINTTTVRTVYGEYYTENDDKKEIIGWSNSFEKNFLNTDTFENLFKNANYNISQTQNSYKNKLNKYKKQLNSLETKISANIVIDQITNEGDPHFDKILHSVLHSYLGDDIIIPYELEARQKKFSAAFKKLAKYIQRHQKPD